MIHHVPSNTDLLIIGASTRAAAFSAIRAGFRPQCLDFYSDADLRHHAPVETLPEDPVELERLLRNWPDVPVMYTGGMEIRPDLLHIISQTHPLWGNSVKTISQLRDPVELKEFARLSRLGYPETRDEQAPPPFDGTWLIRPRSGTGGRGIEDWTEENGHSLTLNEPHLFQKKVEGEPCSAIFIAYREPGDIRFVGMTRQLIGRSESHSIGYQWCGNVAPVSFPVETELLLRRFGNVLKWKSKLAGVFGVDFIIDREGLPWVTEVNPRYPASLELLEHFVGIPFLAEHARCFTGDSLPESQWVASTVSEVLGKAVLFSPADCRLQTEFVDPASVSVDQMPQIADLPMPGTLFRKGDPVCTVFAESNSLEETEERLKEALRWATEQLQEKSVPLDHIH
ncbi:MAG TPA: ATP-grasp domain-containing protein [Planctomicrobium sp.]|nr:ATP-grasp domain-containing protein [Planctomicrobium sp.]